MSPETKDLRRAFYALVKTLLLNSGQTKARRQGVRGSVGKSKQNTEVADVKAAQSNYIQNDIFSLFCNFQASKSDICLSFYFPCGFDSVIIHIWNGDAEKENKRSRVPADVEGGFTNLSAVDSHYACVSLLCVRRCIQDDNVI